MAVRVTKTGGPLTERTRREADFNDVESMREFMDGLAEHAMSSRDYVKAIATDCAEKLVALGIDPDPRNLPYAAEAKGYLHPSREWYVARIANLAHLIERYIEGGNRWFAVRCAIRLGRAQVQGAIISYDRQAALFEEGRKNQARKNRAEADAWRIPARQEAMKIWDDKPNLSASAVARIIRSRGIAEDRSLRSVTGAIAEVRPDKVGRTAQRC